MHIRREKKLCKFVHNELIINNIYNKIMLIYEQTEEILGEYMYVHNCTKITTKHSTTIYDMCVTFQPHFSTYLTNV